MKNLVKGWSVFKSFDGIVLSRRAYFRLDNIITLTKYVSTKAEKEPYVLEDDLPNDIKTKLALLKLTPPPVYIEGVGVARTTGYWVLEDINE